MNASEEITARTKLEPVRVDPRTLGRPVHLLDRFALHLRDDLRDMLRNRVSRRPWAGFEVEAVTLRQSDPSAAMPESGWMCFRNTVGVLSCAIERKLVLGTLAHRYGLRVPAEGSAEASPRITATERRLFDTLGRQFVHLLAARIDAGFGPMSAVEADHGFTALGRLAPAEGGWLIETTVRDDTQGLCSVLQFAVGDTWMTRLFQRVAPARELSAERQVPPTPLADRLTLKLTARLLSQEIELGELCDIKPGDVIPIRLGSTDVLIDDSRLFTAVVAQHKGKLCLTAFEDTE
ncbi:MAG: fliM [Rhizobacter sp.]|jgi:flagellar motor switch protein FliM|nr:fliM [Rhizobacter sp.]